MTQANDEFEKWYKLNGQKTDPLHYVYAKKVWQAAIEFSNSEASKMRQPLKRLSESDIELLAEDIWDNFPYKDTMIFANAIMDEMERINK